MKQQADNFFVPQRKQRKTKFNTTTINLYKNNSCFLYPSQCETYDKTHKLGDRLFVGSETADIKVGYLNVQGPLTVHKLSYICWLFQKQNLRILFLSDTQLTIQTSFFMKKEIKARLGVNTKIISTSQNSQNTGVGGQLAICHENLANYLFNVKSHSSGLGVYFKLGIKLLNSWL